MDLIKISPKDFDGIYLEMQKNFIPEEIRDYESARSITDEAEYSLYHVVDGNTRVGFIAIWELSEFAFAEHFVIYEPYRNKGLGAKALSVLKERYARILLESEPPDNEIKRRRISFYKRLGFWENEIEYIQPPYRKCDTGVKLLLLSYPEKLEHPEAIKQLIYNRVYKIKNI